MSPETIISEVALLTGVPVAAITGRSRTATVVQARFLAIAAIREAFAWWPLDDLAAVFHRTRGSMVNALTRHPHFIHLDPEYATHHAALTATLAAA